MSDLERLDAAVKIIEDLTSLCRNLTEELSEYRSTDQEEQTLNDSMDYLNRILRGGRDNGK